MASASSTSAKNLFQDSKQRLAERVQANINNIGSLTRQLQRGSKSQEILQQTVKNFSACETAINNTSANLEKLQVVTAQLDSQHRTVAAACEKVEQAREQARDMER